MHFCAVVFEQIEGRGSLTRARRAKPATDRGTAILAVRRGEAPALK